MRSLIDPPGLELSIFRYSSQTPVSKRWALTMGVLPMSSRTEEWMAIGLPCIAPRSGRTGDYPLDGAGSQATPGYQLRPERSAGDNNPGKVAIAREEPQRGEGSVQRTFIDPQQLLLGQQLLAFHLCQCRGIDRKHSQACVRAFLVQLPVLLVELLELGIGFHQRIDFTLRLPFKHDYLLHTDTQTPRPCGTGRCGMEHQVDACGMEPSIGPRSSCRMLPGTGSRHRYIGSALRCPDDEIAARTIDPTPAK